MLYMEKMIKDWLGNLLPGFLTVLITVIVTNGSGFWLGLAVGLLFEFVIAEPAGSALSKFITDLEKKVVK